jgi:inosine-uridine nucleoside N-ribohydrolase
MEVRRRKLILDVDTGTDDAVAILLAALHPALELIACTTVHGNVEVQDATDNTLRVLHYISREEIPVHAGLARPLVRADYPVPRATWDPRGKLHGRTLPLPPAVQLAASRSAVEFLVETYRSATDEITLVAVAPFTNIATALTLEPKLADRVPEVVIMGGSHAIGNITPSAEFNVWCDPEAASIVFSAPFRKRTLVPLDATHRALVSQADCEALRALGTPAGHLAAELVGQRIAAHDAAQPMVRSGTAPVHDAVCVAYLADPSVISTQRLHVGVETTDSLTLGRTVIDTHRRGPGEPQCDVAFDADAKRLMATWIKAFAEDGGAEVRGARATGPREA